MAPAVPDRSVPVDASPDPGRPLRRAARRALGAEGEALAAAWYERAGYEVLARNWRCGAGEIDLVCRAGGTLVVCEVKTRTSADRGTPLEAVTGAKRRRLRRLAGSWLAQQHERFEEVRFDVAAVTGGRVEVTCGAF